MKKSWEWVTQLFGLQLCAPLNIKLDAKKLQEDVRRVLDHYPLQGYQNAKNYSGSWNFVGLITRGGSPGEGRDFVEGDFLKADFLETEAMRYCPYIKQVLDDLKCVKERVRIMALEPGSSVVWHLDNQIRFERGVLRCHIPVFPNPDSYIQMGHKRNCWKAGEIWCGDFTFPHCGFNGGENPRIHIIADLVMNDFLADLVPRSYLEEDKGRKKRIAKKICARLMHFHKDPKGAVEYLIRWPVRKIFHQAGKSPG